MNIPSEIIPMSDDTRRTESDPQRIRRLFLCLDGLRYSCAIADMCYKRALDTLRTFETLPEASPPITHVVGAIADVWSIVDAAHRVRQLVSQLPLVKHVPRQDLPDSLT